jgi:hypothetical protein
MLPARCGSQVPFIDQLIPITAHRLVPMVARIAHDAYIIEIRGVSIRKTRLKLKDIDTLN